MTVGERIQFYRKQNGLSQEELARMLIVSRQTVSLWENGQTLPTIDNLIRLRDIFGITVDEMLVGEPVAHQAAEEPSDSAVQAPDAPQNAPKNSRRTVWVRIVAIAAPVLLALAVVVITSLLAATKPMRAAERALGARLPSADYTVSVSHGIVTDAVDIDYVTELYYTDHQRIDEILSLSDMWAEDCPWLSVLLSDVQDISGSYALIVFCTDTAEYGKRADAVSRYTVICCYPDEGMIRILSFEA